MTAQAQSDVMSDLFRLKREMKALEDKVAHGRFEELVGHAVALHEASADLWLKVKLAENS